MPADDEARARLGFDVTATDTALALGSGEVAVLATPRLLAWCEAATCAAAALPAAGLPAGATTVGSRVVLEHHLPTPVGGRVEVDARLVSVTGRVLLFEVRATDRAGRVVGSAEVTRVAVDVERFVERLPEP